MRSWSAVRRFRLRGGGGGRRAGAAAPHRDHQVRRPAATRARTGPAAPHLYGAVIFGAGFGLTGTCPGRAVAMVATGGLGGLLVLTGLVGGMWLRGATARPAPGQQPKATADRLPVQPRSPDLLSAEPRCR